MPAAAVAVAAWVSSAALTVVGTTATGYAIATAASSAILALGGAAGIGAAISAWSTVATLSGALARPPKVGSGDSGGTQIDFKADPNAGIPLVLGRTGTGGVIVHANTSGQVNKNSHLAFCTVLSAGPVEAIESLSANDEEVAFASELAATTKYAGAMWTRNQLGAKPSGSFIYPGVPAGWIPEWTEDHKLSGLAASWFVLHTAPEAYAGGAPKPTWVVKGVAVYDPAQDSTYPGGVGACRADDESTWVFDRAGNPILQALSFCLGRRSNGVLTHGLGAPPELIDVAAFLAHAEICEENGWAIGGVVTSADSKWEVLRAMLQAGGAVPMKLGARLSCLGNAPRVSLNASTPWTGADLVGEAQITATRSRRDRINAIIPRYRSEAHNWQMVSNAVVSVSTYETEDGGPRTREMEYALVQDPAQAAQLAAYDVVNSREIGPIVLPSKPAYVGYVPGDCITVNEPEIGLENRKVLILGRTVDSAAGTVTLVCQTETDAKHDFALGRTDVAPPTPGLSASDPALSEAPAGDAFTLTGETLVADAQSIPALVLEGESDNPNAAQLLVQYRPVGASDWASWPAVSLPDTETTVRVEITGVTAETDYEVRSAYRSLRGSTSPWRDEGTVTAGEWALAGLSAALSDGVLTPGEKLYVVPQVYGLIDGRAAIRANADAVNALVGNNLERLAYENAATALDAVLASWDTPVDWDDSSAATEVPDPAAFITAFRSSLASERNLQSQITYLWGQTVTDLSDELAEAVSDGNLTPAEKMIIIPQINGMIGARAALRDRADALRLTYAASSVRAGWEDWSAALDVALASYTTPVAWNNYTDSTTIPSPAGFREILEEIVKRTSDLQTAIDKVAGDRTRFFDPGSGINLDYQTMLFGWNVNGGVAGRASQPLTSSDSAVAVAAHSILFPNYSGGNVTVNVPATTFYGLASGTAYTVYYRPQFFDWAIVPSSVEAAYATSRDGWMFIGRILTSVGSTYFPPAFDSDLGLIGYCVAASAYLASGKRAGAAQVGDDLILLNPAGDGVMAGDVTAMGRGVEPCLTFTTARAVLTVSQSTPMMTRQGPGFLPRPVRASAFRIGDVVPVLVPSEDGAQALVWEPVTSITAVGRQPVAKISADHGVYAASDQPGGPWMLTHNVYAKF